MTAGATVPHRIHRSVRICLAGTAPDTGNLGVDALYASVLAQLGGLPEMRSVSVLDNGWGVRTVAHSFGPFELEHCGARRSRRWHRPESWAAIRIASALGGLRNPVASRLRAATAVLDLTAGDSFSDIYGRWRYEASVAAKRAALAVGRPLILLPQTYGPFSDPALRADAARLVRGARVAYSRDPVSHDVLLDLLDGVADPSRHRRGVDVAFALPARDPGDRLPPALRRHLGSRSRPMVGMNISGLLYNDPARAASFGLELDYRSLVRRTVDSLVETGCDVLLVPHVAGSQGNGFEDDHRAATNLISALGDVLCERVHVVPWGLGSQGTKWLIAQLDWFCGARMHATIAGLSSGVPTSAIAYSMKTRGVFATCGQEERVVDARTVDESDALERLLASYQDREATGRALATSVMPVRHQAATQVLEALMAALDGVAS